MAISRDEERKYNYHAVFSVIKAYNDDNPQAPITFIHGGSSAVFAFVGRKVQIKQRQKSPNGTINENITQAIVPNALIPTGILRNRYGIYPVSGELEVGAFAGGRRKQGVNYTNISGMFPEDVNAVALCLGYAEDYTKPIPDASVIHQNIVDLIGRIGPYTYLRILKQLVMHVTNLMLIDPQAHEHAERYLKLLQNEYDVLKKQKLMGRI